MKPIEGVAEYSGDTVCVNSNYTVELFVNEGEGSSALIELDVRGARKLAEDLIKASGRVLAKLEAENGQGI